MKYYRVEFHYSIGDKGGGINFLSFMCNMDEITERVDHWINNWKKERNHESAIISKVILNGKEINLKQM
jgi:hypothetical protein